MERAERNDADRRDAGRSDAGRSGKAPPPKDFGSLRNLIAAEHGQMPKRLAQVAAFMLDNPDEVALGTSASVAELAKVQPSTLVRFAQTLGFSGFSDLQALFRERLRGYWPTYGDRVQALRSDDETEASHRLLGRFAETAISSIERLRESVTAEDIDRATRTLAAARTIYLLGQKRSYPVASYLAYAFQKLGHPAVLLENAAGTIVEQAAFMTPDDALLVISFTPYSPVSVEIATRAKQAEVPVVAVSDSAFSPLASVAEVWLEVVETDLSGFRALSATLCLAMTLAVGAAEQRSGGIS